MTPTSTLPASSAAEMRLAGWRAAWPTALSAWSRFTRLHDPLLCESKPVAATHGLTGSFAMIRLDDQGIVVDLETVHKLGLEDYAVEILAHEIGHHVLAPGNLSDHFRLLARIRKALPTLEQHAPLVANLYTDLLINDRLQRQGGLRMSDIYRKMEAARTAEGEAGTNWVWALYLRIYEHLWRLDQGDLTRAPLPRGKLGEGLDSDAWLGARLVRVYADDWMHGAGSFATLLLRYLVEDAAQADGSGVMEWIQDTRSAASGSEPQGGIDIEPDEGEARHPVEDPRVSGLDEGEGHSGDVDTEPHDIRSTAGNAPGQAREPWEYGAILKSAGIDLSDHDIAIRYYRTRALPYLVPFPSRSNPQSPEPLVEGLEPWSIGDSLDEVDWLQSVMVSPRPIPGQSTVKRFYGREEGRARQRRPVDLDLYVDSSGSMPNPQVQVSYLTLAGAIIALSALRTGSRVQATLWSSQDQITTTRGFVRDENAILGVLTGYYGGGTAFPIHHLRRTYANPRPDGHLERPVHILHISDDGITTMFDKDEKGHDGWEVCEKTLAIAGGGGTMALNLPDDWISRAAQWASYRQIERAGQDMGWAIHAISELSGLLEFARAFAQRHYAERTDTPDSPMP